MLDSLVLLSIPQLRQRDLAPGALASLEGLARRGEVAEFQPAFPSLPASAFASLVTGCVPAQHGIVGDAFFDRESHQVVARPFQDGDVARPKLWERFRELRPGAATLAWFTPSLRGAGVDLAAWVDPESGLSTQPSDLAARLEARSGAYPAPRALPGGEPLRLQATEWILKTAGGMIAEARPGLAIVRLPYLGQVARRYGPDSPRAGRAVLELEQVLKPFLASLVGQPLVVAVTESVSTPVTAPTYPNLVLRGLGLLELTSCAGGGTDIDTRQSAAFALVDHQLCHIYLNDPTVAASIASAFSGDEADGVATVAGRRQMRGLGLDHPRSGDIVLVSRPDSWFASNWWRTPAERPAQTGAGSGLGLDLLIKPEHVQGSLGAPPPSADYHGIVLCSRRGVLPAQAGVVKAGQLMPALLAAAIW